MEFIFKSNVTPWSKIKPTAKQIMAIESYEKTANVRIYINSKQDAHDVISQFCKNGIIFEKGLIKNTNIKYAENGNSVDGKILSNDPEIDTIQPKIFRITGNLYGIMSELSRQTFNFSDDDDDCFGGADPYTMFY